MKKFASVTTLVLLLAGSLPAYSAPIQLPIGLAAVSSPPTITADAWILYDDTFEIVLAEFNADERLPMASTTKIMTGILAVENGNMDDLVSVSQLAVDVGEAEINLEAGEQLTLKQLTGALMVRSANDAAIAVGEHIAGSLPAFIDMMNARALELGLENTHFVNPHGLDSTEHYTSARDLLAMARHGMQYEQFAEFASTTSVTIPNASDGTPRVATATNHMLTDYPGALGVKTGYTDRAKLVLAAAAERDGRRLYAVVMGSNQHFADATALLDYGFDNFRLQSVMVVGEHHPPVRTPLPEQPTTQDEPQQEPDEPVVIQTGPAIVDGSPVLVSTADGSEVSLSQVEEHPPERLPSLTDAFDWFTGLFK